MFQMDLNFILMRHAHSKHNELKKNKFSSNEDKQFKKSASYKAFKYSKELIDSDWIDTAQCEKIRDEIIDMKKVKLVITSPLQRCLYTCQTLCQFQPQIPVFVEPLLTSRIASAWTIGSNLSALKLKFPLFDFTALEKQHWMIELINDKVSSQNNFTSQLCWKQKLLDQLASGKQETFLDLNRRTFKFKLKLKQFLEKNKIIEPSSERNIILIISHSCTLKSFTSTEFDENGKNKYKTEFKHCKPNYYSSKQLFQTNSDVIHSKI